MEDGACDFVTSAETQEIKNGTVASIITNLPGESVSPISEDVEVFDKVNGDSNIESNTCEDEYSSESDALVIDESVPKKIPNKRKPKPRSKSVKKTVKDAEVLTHSNPFFNESLYELSQQHQNLQTDNPTLETPNERSEVKVNNCKVHKHKKAKNKSPKREYAQYLGLQPTVQFKCSKCGQAGFETLIALNDHIVQCDAVPILQQPTSDNSSSIKLTRKVFLCSACGTYYENWNLYLHMLELHRRFICLYCLGMFSAPNDLCLHIQSRHNLQPGHKNSLDEFLNVYSEPCYVVCCECNKLFSEEDNFFYHNCIKSNNKSNQKMLPKGKTPKVQIRPENHVTGDSGSLSQEVTESNINKVTELNKDPVKDDCDSLVDKGQDLIPRNIDEDPVSQNINETSEDVHCLQPLENHNKDTDSELTNNLDSSEKQSMEEAVAKEISNNLDTSMHSDIHISHNSNSENESNIEVNSELPVEHFDKEHTISEDDEENRIEDSHNFNSVPPHERNLITDHLEQSESHNEKTDISQNTTGEENLSDLHLSVPSENDEELNDLNKEDEEAEDCDYDNDGDDEDDGDNNEEKDLFSENDLEGATVFSNRDDNTGSLMDSSEKLRLDSSQDEAELLETSEPEPSLERDGETELRKVPKLSLKLPKPGSCKDMSNDDSDDSEKLTMEIDQMESESEINDSNKMNISEVCNPGNNESFISDEPHLQIAGPDVTIVELQLEQPLDKFDVKVLLQKCLKATSPFCVYCNHARKIAVNGKQLGLHAIAEHRYSAVVNSITAEELMPETFVVRIRENLDELADVFFSLESGVSGEGVTFSHVFECFQCRYSTTVHKELYLHNRKLHTKNLLLCIMCKSNFYSYSELICHLCPGVYVLDYDTQFRCCMCVSDDLPSAFRLMVHLRKRHHVCDVCLESCHNQYKLSNHVWKHKLHHFCYRCCIAYRNKPDITRHLFWKHGTESVLCKKCLQKKWPHVYHFCVPPPSFSCDECSLTFTRAVSLKVHKRIHYEYKPHVCTIDDCGERFISKKLLFKHDMKHREPVEEIKSEVLADEHEHEESNGTSKKPTEILENESQEVEPKVEEKVKPKVDVYDLPELNLSESDSDSDVEAAKQNKTEETNAVSTSDDAVKTEGVLELNLLENMCETNILQEDKISLLDNVMEKSAFDDFEPSEKIPPILENIWDDFKNYQAEKEKIDHMFTDRDKVEERDLIEEKDVIEAAKTEGLAEDKLTVKAALLDHDYCYISEPQTDTSMTEVKPDLTQRVDHDYCSPKGNEASSPTKSIGDKAIVNEDVKSTPKKRTASTSSGSSSSSDSSSCTCGSNCSCSSSSGSSSSSSESSDSDSSTEEGRKRQQLKRERRKEKAKNKKLETQKEPEIISVDQPPPIVEVPIQETDLDTTESETDEEFYDKQPQKLAKKILEEKRNQLLAEVGTTLSDTWLETSRATTPNLPEEDTKPKKKSKSKKKKKRKSERKEQSNQSYTATDIPTSTYYQCYQQPSTVAPITLTIRNSPVPSQASVSLQNTSSKSNESLANTRTDDSNLRASKRRRVPNKFYGYSSDEDAEKGPSHHASKWKKQEAVSLPQSPLTVPPLTIKTAQLTPQPPIEPLTIRPAAQTGELKVHSRPTPPLRLPPPKSFVPVLPPQRELHHQLEESGSESNESSTEENHKAPEKPVQPQLYCYCRCPYDEVSEMIGCDSSDCAIEWFHFECVGIMVPPKGQWFCPDCRKKKQQRRELLQT